MKLEVCFILGSGVFFWACQGKSDSKSQNLSDLSSRPKLEVPQEFSQLSAVMSTMPSDIKLKVDQEILKAVGGQNVANPMDTITQIQDFANSNQVKNAAVEAVSETTGKDVAQLVQVGAQKMGQLFQSVVSSYEFKEPLECFQDAFEKDNKIEMAGCAYMAMSSVAEANNEAQGEISATVSEGIDCSKLQFIDLDTAEQLSFVPHSGDKSLHIDFARAATGGSSRPAFLPGEKMFSGLYLSSKLGDGAHNQKGLMVWSASARSGSGEYVVSSTKGGVSSSFPTDPLAGLLVLVNREGIAQVTIDAKRASGGSKRLVIGNLTYPIAQKDVSDPVGFINAYQDLRQAILGEGIGRMATPWKPAHLTYCLGTLTHPSQEKSLEGIIFLTRD